MKEKKSVKWGIVANLHNVQGVSNLSIVFINLSKKISENILRT